MLELGREQTEVRLERYVLVHDSRLAGIRSAVKLCGLALPQRFRRTVSEDGKRMQSEGAKRGREEEVARRCEGLWQEH